MTATIEPLARLDRDLLAVDPDIARALRGEVDRQNDYLEMIASENFVSRAVLQAASSVLTNKYAEGYPGRRYYGGCQYADQVEELARQRAKELFGAEHANVQPHSGSQANMAVYFSTLKPGDTILGMDLSHGGHLTHGHRLSYSGSYHVVHFYGVDRETETIDYDALEALAVEKKPAMIVCGASAYPRIIDFERIAAIAARVGAKMMADIAHIAGLVVAGLHPSPVPHADFVTTTTHKTLRGPRGGMILCRESDQKAIDRAVFPGIQGGPLMHIIAAKAVAFAEAFEPGFEAYQRQTLANCQALAGALVDRGLRLVSGGTDNHLILVDVGVLGVSGKDAEAALEEAGITSNKNTIPFDQRKPAFASGIRLGTPALTTRGLGEAEMKMIGAWIADVLGSPEDGEKRRHVRAQVGDLCRRFPLYQEP